MINRLIERRGKEKIGQVFWKMVVPHSSALLFACARFFPPFFPDFSRVILRFLEINPKNEYTWPHGQARPAGMRLGRLTVVLELGVSAGRGLAHMQMHTQTRP